MYTVSLKEYNTTPTENTPTENTPTISTDELYIFDPLTTDEGLMLTDPTLSLEASCAGSFTCDIPETNYGYGRIIKRRTRVIVRKDDKVIFMGRINTEERDLYLTQKIEAEGALAYLNDSLTEKKTYSYKSLPYILNDIFTNHNNKFSGEPWKQFYFPYDSATDTSTNCKAEFTGRDDTDASSNKLSQYNVNFNNTMEIVTELLDIANAVLKIEYNDTTEKWDVYIYKKYDYATDGSNFPVNSQPIEFGVNLIELMQSYDNTDYCSCVAPFGGDAIQVDKSIGDNVAGRDISNDYSQYYADAIWVRDKDDPDDDYERYAAVDAGYWVIDLWIGDYNAANPNNKLKKLYVSWRGYYFETHSGEPAGEGKCEDCAWRIYDQVGNSLGYKKFDTNGGFDEAINDEIDLTQPQYLGAYRIVVSGWGGAIRPLIKRDATVVEENDKLNITKCDVMGSEETDDLVHEEDSFYLYSKSLVKSIGLVEKKLEYDIEDSAPPATDNDYPYWLYYLDEYNVPHYRNYSGGLGTTTFYNECYLGYNVGNIGEEANENMNKGDFQILDDAGAGYACIQYELPDLNSKNYPRGIYISSRMHTLNAYIDDRGDGKYWKVNGMYALYDSSWQVLSYKEAGSDLFTSLKDEYIDLSAPENYGAKYIRVGGWGGSIPVNVRPSNDHYSRDRLLAQAELYLTSSQWEKSVIEASAVDLNMTSGEFERFDICTLIEVISDYHGVYTFLPLTRLELHLDNYANNSIKVGYDSDSYLSYQLNESLRASAVEETIEERRKEET